MFDQVTAVIPVRKGSTRVVGKNLRPFTQTGSAEVEDSLLSWKIKQLSQVLEPKNILVSSDWPEALAVAKTLGCATHVRPAWLCTADAPFDEVIGTIAQTIKTSDMLWAPVTSPFAGPSTTKTFLETYSSLSVPQKEQGLILTSELRNYFFMSNRPLNFKTGQGHVRTQDIPTLTQMSWALSARPTQTALVEKYMFGDKPTFQSGTILENFDINDDIDFRIAQNLVALYFEIEAGV